MSRVEIGEPSCATLIWVNRKMWIDLSQDVICDAAATLTEPMAYTQPSSRGDAVALIQTLLYRPQAKQPQGRTAMIPAIN